MAAPVRIESGAFSDPRFEMLGMLLGTSRFDAIGRMAFVWSWCTERGTHDIPSWVANVYLDGHAEYLVISELGEWSPCSCPAERQQNPAACQHVRVRGTSGRIEWLGEKRVAKENGGKARVANAERDEKGRLLARRPAGVQQPVQQDNQQKSSRSPAGSSALTLAPALTPSDSEHSPARAETDALVLARRHQADAGWARFSDIRRRVAADLGEPPPRELHPLDPGRAELQARLLEAGHERSDADLDHVLAVLEAEALAQGTMRWLDGGAFRAERWSRAIASSPAEAAKPRKPRRGPAGESDVRVGRIEPHAPSAYPDGEVTL